MPIANARGSRLVLGTGIGLLLVALMHGLGYLQLRTVLEPVPADLRPLLPLLWFSFAAHYVVFGILLVVVGWRHADGGRALLACAALVPLLDAVLQVATIGFSAPAAMLLAVSALGFAAAGRARPATAAGGRH